MVYETHTSSHTPEGALLVGCVELPDARVAPVTIHGEVHRRVRATVPQVACVY